MQISALDREVSASATRNHFMSNQIAANSMRLVGRFVCEHEYE
jgi:hypothetical protein